MILTVNEVEIIAVNDKNAADCGRIIYEAWGETYRGLIPDKVLDGKSLEKCIERARHGCENYRLALIGGKPAGTVVMLNEARDFCTCPESGEIVALYVLKKYQRMGVGKALMTCALDDTDKDKVTLFVLKGNVNAIAFYRYMGFEFTGKELNMDGMTELEMIYEK